MKKLTHPHIDIEYNRFLAPVFDFYIKNTLEKDNPAWKRPKLEDAKVNIEKQQSEWKKVESGILKGLQEVTGLTFFENRIPVYVVPIQKGAFSDPIVISSTIPPDRFVDLLTHELVHRLVTQDNEKAEVGEALKKLFPEVKERLGLNHIFVHAVHKHIYLNVLQNENRLKRDIEFFQNYPAYKEAWDIVGKEGYKEIIKRAKNKYLSV